MNYKSFKKIKIHELAISLARGKSLQTKKKEIERLFQPVCGQERDHFDLISLVIVSLPRAETVSLNLHIRVLKISTARIDE